MSILPADPKDLPPLLMPKIAEYQQIGDRVATEIKRKYTDRAQQHKALKRVADTYYNLPRGYDFLIADVEAHVGPAAVAATATPTATATVI
jgi:hypothetical protein